MRRGTDLPLVVAGQFCGALADSALLLVALQALAQEHAPSWQAPMLRILFYGAYVLLAVLSGALADAFAKRDVLVVTGLFKLAGCAMLAAGASPLAAYAFVGLAAVSHMPARYGILGEIAAPPALLRANAWLEGATLAATLAGVLVAGALLSGRGPAAASGGSAHAAAGWLLVPYFAAAACCLFVRRTPAAAAGLRQRAAGMPRQFAGVARALWAQPPCRRALAFTTMVWALAAVLQFEVLRWGGERFGLPLAQCVLLQLAVALGMIAGAAAAGRWASAARLHYVPWAGAGAGVVLAALALLHDLRWAVVLLVVLGGLAGLVLVPMNAVVQEHGARARRPGEWLAVQHFVENAGSLALLALYGAALYAGVSASEVVVLLGLAVGLPSIAAGWAQRAGAARVPARLRR